MGLHKWEYWVWAISAHITCHHQHSKDIDCRSGNAKCTFTQTDISISITDDGAQGFQSRLLALDILSNGNNVMGYILEHWEFIGTIGWWPDHNIILISGLYIYLEVLLSADIGHCRRSWSLTWFQKLLRLKSILFTHLEVLLLQLQRSLQLLLNPQKTQTNRLTHKLQHNKQKRGRSLSSFVQYLILRCHVMSYAYGTTLK